MDTLPMAEGEGTNAVGEKERFYIVGKPIK